MPNLSQLTIIGHLGDTPLIRATQSGAKVLNAKVAVNTGWGEQKRTTWWAVTVFGKQAETLEGFNLQKGEPICFFGEASLREYESNGKKGYSAELLANGFSLMSKKEDKPAAHAAATRVNPEPPFDDEIPF
jgi:single stranded DNA-binding protein